MKAHRFIQRTPRRIIAGMFITALLSNANAGTNHATETGMQNIRNSTAAVIYLVPEYVSTPTNLDEGAIVKMGCRYDLRDAAVQELASIIERSGVAATAPAEAKGRGPLDVRLLVHFERPEEAPVVFAFERLAMPGKNLSGALDGQPVSTTTNVFKTVYSWLSNFSPTRKPYSSCPSTSGR